MHRFGLLKPLLKPSTLSATLCSVLAVGMLSSANWIYLDKTTSLSTHIFGQYGPTVYLQRAPGTLLNTILGASKQQIVYDILVAVVALMAGTVAYFITEGLYRMHSNAAAPQTQEQVVGDTPSLHHVKLTRFYLRIYILICAAAYGVVLLKMLIPLCVIISHFGVQELSTVSGIGYVVLSLVILVISLHLCTVLLRLFFLRTRVIGYDESVLKGSSQQS